MNLVNYIDRVVHVTLIDNFFYIGQVLDADENSITLKDKNNRLVSLDKKSILTIREVTKCNT